MGQGIRATVTFDNPDICPIVRLSDETGATVESVSTSVSTGDATESVTEFSLDADRDGDDEVEPVISYGSTHVYRRSHGGTATCPCECLGEFGCPVRRYFAANGELTLVFHAADYDELQAVVRTLRDRHPEVDIKRFVRSPAEDHSEDTVFVDRTQLTDKQRRVLTTAYEMGYFERPRQANATEIAEELDISPSTFTEHLLAAQQKLLGDVLEED